MNFNLIRFSYKYKKMKNEVIFFMFTVAGYCFSYYSCCCFCHQHTLRLSYLHLMDCFTPSKRINSLNACTSMNGD